MLPVRWKLLAVIAICLAHMSSTAKTRRELTEDGWKPIVGHRESNYNEKFMEYRTAIKNIETAKPEQRPLNSEAISPQPKPTTSINNINNLHHGHHHGKVPPHVKHYVKNQGHGSQMMNFMTHRTQNKPYKVPVSGKNHGHVQMNGKRPMKPVRVQAAAQSQREEVFVPAPTTGIGNYAYFNQGQSSLKSRLNQPHGHFEFANHFGQNDNIFQFQRLPTQQYVLPKYPIQNDVHYTFQAQNDEYTRNLVPPPRLKPIQDNEKQKHKLVYKQQEQPITEQVQVTKHKIEQTQTSALPENTLVQVVPSYQQQTYYIPNQHQAQAVDVQVTKEKLTEYHNNNSPNYNSQDEVINYPNYEFVKNPSETPQLPNYEVTEGKLWRGTSAYQQQAPIQVQYVNRGSSRTKRPQIQVENIQTFLPTPVKPDLVPTSPTQSEVSTIFAELSQKINKQKEDMDQSFYNIKEVSTHYPILGQPEFKQYNVQYKMVPQNYPEHSDETSGVKINQNSDSFSEEVETTMIPTNPPITTMPTRVLQQKRKPNHKRRRPTVNTRVTTTEEPAAITPYETYKTEPIEESTPRQKPQRRRPVHRTTEATVLIEDRPTRRRYRQRPRPTQEIMETVEMPYNHKMSHDFSQKPTRGSYSPYEEQYDKSTESFRKSPIQYNNYEKYEVSSESMEENQNQNKYNSNVYERPIKHRKEETMKSYDDMYPGEESNEQKYIMAEDNEESTEYVNTSTEKIEVETRRKNIRRPLVVTTTEQEPATNIHTPENEVDYSTTNPVDNLRQTIIIKEVYTSEPENNDETTLATTTTTTTTTSTTTTTPEPTTTKITRPKRPLHYKSERPRFSVKEYKQRLNRYMSTTSEPNKSTTEAPKSRLPHRTRKPVRPQPEQKPDVEENNNEVQRGKFVPKDPRHASSSNIKVIESTKAITSNSRLRPFGRHHSTTTETTTTYKVSIKPNIFNNSRRPTHASLRTRIHNRYHRNNTSEKTTKIPEVEHIENATSEPVAATEPYHKDVTETSQNVDKVADVETTTAQVRSTTVSSEEMEFNEMEILKNDAFLQSKRVSDLTSSAHNDYNTPGMFKSVSPNVRRVPSFYTISTDDPILPIEAFFPNINKEKQ